MAYALETAREELKRSLPWLRKSVDREALDGFYDGTNRVFHLPVVPADPGSTVSLYDSDGIAVTNGWQVTSYDHGTVSFSSGSLPTNPVYASYVFQSVSDSKLLDLCYAGFDEMEARYPRGLYAVASGNSTYVSSTADTVTDPVCADRTFSTSRTQIDFLLACSEYRLLRALWTEASLNAINFREERVGGLMVDTTRRPEGFAKLMADAETRMTTKQQLAAIEVGGSNLGSFVPGAQSDSYKTGYSWWETSDQATGL